MTWEAIEEVTLVAPAASVSFNTGLSGYKFFRLTGYVKNDGNAKTVSVRFNNDSGNNYIRQAIRASSTSVSGERPAATDAVYLDTGNNFAANEHSSFGVLIAKPATSVKGQVISIQGVNASPAMILGGAEWNDTTAMISRIDVTASSGDFAAGTSILLEGLAF